MSQLEPFHQPIGYAFNYGGDEPTQFFVRHGGALIGFSRASFVGFSGGYAVLRTKKSVPQPIYGRVRYWLMDGNLKCWPDEGMQGLGRSPDGFFFGYYQGKAWIWNASLEVISSFPGIHIQYVYRDTVIFRNTDGKIGAMDFAGNVLVEPVFAGVRHRNFGCTIFFEELNSGDNKYFVWDYVNMTKIKRKRQGIKPIGSGRLAYYDFGPGKKKWGIMDFNGQVLCDPQYIFETSHAGNHGLRPLYFNRSLVQNDEGKFGYCDENGNMVVPFQFAYATEFQNGYALVTDDRDTYIIDVDGKAISRVFERCFNCERYFQDEKLRVYDKGGFLVKTESNACGIINIDGSVRLMLDARFGIEGIDRFYGEYASVKSNLKPNESSWFNIGCIHKSGAFMFEPKFLGALAGPLPHIVGERVPVRNARHGDSNWKYGYVNHEGELVAPYQFDAAMNFYEQRFPDLETTDLFNEPELKFHREHYLPDVFS